MSGINGSIWAMLCASLVNGMACICLAAGPAGAAAPRDPATLRPEEFVTVTGEHLTRDGKIMRYWGAQGNIIAPTYADIEHEVSVLRNSGFNLYRLASHSMSPWVGGSKGEYKPGDLSATDRFFYTVAACGRQDVAVWMVDLGTPRWGNFNDASLIDDPATAEKWTEAVSQMLDSKSTVSKDFRMASVFDPRLKEAWKKHIRGVLNTVNPYTGLRLADDPAIVTWEISNEMWAGARLLWGNHLTLPDFIRDEIQQSWIDWLKQRYATHDELVKAWGSVLPGEDLAAGQVLMLPLDNRKPISADIVAYGVNVKLTPGQANGDDLPVARARDVRSFIVERVREFKAELIATARAEGRPGIGVSVVPIIADTEFNGTTVSLWQNMVGSATTPSLYHDMTGGDPTNPRFPWYSGLFGTPVFNDWFDDKRVRGKPTMLYEGMIWLPQKYAVEFPWRIAAQGAVQDFSCLDFHYYGHPLPAGSKDLTALEQSPISTTTPQRLPDGLIFRSHPALMASFRAAGEVFARGYLKPAPEPVTLVLGRKSLESLDNKKGNDPAIRATAYHKGFRYDFDPTAEEDRLEGELIDPNVPPGVFSPTRGLTYDTPNGRMIIDVPEAKAVVGFLDASHAFEGDVKVEQITIANPPDMPFVVEGERYAAISLVSLDNNELASSSDILVTAANVAWNTGFEFDASKRGAALNDAMGFAKAIVKRGKAPVIEGRVGCVFVAPWLKGRTAILTDRFAREIGRYELADGRLTWPADQPVYEIRVVNRSSE